MTKKNIARKGKKRQGVHIRNDKKYEVPSSDESDIIYGEVAKGKKNPDQKNFMDGWNNA